MSLGETYVTVQGWVGSEPDFKEIGGQTATGDVPDRLDTRQYDRTLGTYVDKPTTWFTVECWRALAQNAFDSVHARPAGHRHRPAADPRMDRRSRRIPQPRRPRSLLPRPRPHPRYDDLHQSPSALSHASAAVGETASEAAASPTRSDRPVGPAEATASPYPADEYSAAPLPLTPHHPGVGGGMTISVLTYISPERHSGLHHSRNERETAVIDILEHINAVQREVSRTGETVTVRDAPVVPGRARGALGRADGSGADAPLVPAGHRRLQGRRHLPAGGQRRRRDPGMRTTQAFQGHLRRPDQPARASFAPRRRGFDRAGARALDGRSHRLPAAPARSGSAPAGTAACSASPSTSPANSTRTATRSRWPTPPRSSSTTSSRSAPGSKRSAPPGPPPKTTSPKPPRSPWPSTRPTQRSDPSAGP